MQDIKATGPTELFRKLLATDHRLDFQSPPPPDLRYHYPPATPQIVKNIAEQMRTHPPFYIQVLHLMNRMNLPPPFSGSSCQSVDVGSQTDKISWPRKPDLATDESELESEEEEGKPADKSQRKRKSSPSFSIERKRLRAIIAMEKETRSRSGPTLRSDPLETPDLVQPKPLKIAVIIKPAVPPSISEEPSLRIVQVSRIPINELVATNPIFSNYNPGIPSNVLYIKNLAKSVKEKDLQHLFHEFDSSALIDLKTTGRLRGQAFVTFQKVDQDTIGRALEHTNGLVMDGKPIYVCYSKSKTLK